MRAIINIYRVVIQSLCCDQLTRLQIKRSVLVKWVTCFSVASLLLSFGLPTAHADVQYVYDETDRLVEVVDATGNSAIYQYDAAGNPLAIRRYVSGNLAIAEFTPDRGPVGTAVTIYGLGFSATTAGNTVKFNGTLATVSSASATKLTVKVPAGATSGLISVTVGTQTATSTDSFTVTTEPVNPAPVITNFTPTIGPAGTAVTINGNYFETVPANNTVIFNKFVANITTSTKTQINTTVPNDFSSGKLSVMNAYGMATSSADFFVIPNGYTSAQIAVNTRLAINGAASAINIPTSDNIAMVLFDGVRGQNLALGISPLTFATSGFATLRIITPQGAELMPQQIVNNPVNYDLPTLPSTGTYTLLITSALSSLNATLTLSSELTGTLTANGAAQAFTSTRVGQNARYSFTGTLRQGFGLSVNSLVTTSVGGTVSLMVYKPDGSLLIDCGSITADSSCDLPVLPVAGTYSLLVNPVGINTASLNILLSADVTGMLTTSGAAQTFTSTRIGQNARYSFTGTLGQGFGLSVNSLVTTPAGQSVSLKVYKPDGSLLIDCGSVTADSSCDFPVLPVAGTYTLLVNPVGLYTASLNILLSADVTGTLTANGAAQTFTSTRIGQNARYSFSGIAGKSMSLLMTGDTFPIFTYITVYQPDGTKLTDTFLAFTTGTSQDGILDFPSLPVTGTYSVFVNPGTVTGGVNLKLFEDLTGSIAVNNSTATAVNLPIGQNASYTFTGAFGQGLGLAYSNLVTTPTQVRISLTVFKPDGSLLKDCGAPYSDDNCDFPLLPVAGTYRIQVNPSGMNAASVNLLLSSDITGTLIKNGATLTYTTARPGQNARYSFSGTAGQTPNIVITGDTFFGYTLLYLYRPDGTQLALETQLYMSGAATNGTIIFPSLPVTGTYSLLVSPSSTSTGTMQIGLQ